MSYIGRKPTNAALTASDIADDIVTLAKMAGGTDGNIITYDASGDPVAVATGSDGQVLTSTGAGSPPAFEAAAGITAAQQWRLTSDFDGSATITSNLEAADTLGAGAIGSAMTESSGVFTFPSTGIWLIQYTIVWRGNSDSDVAYAGGQITVTSDNSNYAGVSTGYNGCNNHGANYYMTTTMHHIFDVTNTTTHKVKFNASTSISGLTCVGNTGENYTTMMFVRLGDT